MLMCWFFIFILALVLSVGVRVRCASSTSFRDGPRNHEMIQKEEGNENCIYTPVLQCYSAAQHTHTHTNTHHTPLGYAHLNSLYSVQKQKERENINFILYKTKETIQCFWYFHFFPLLLLLYFLRKQFRWAIITNTKRVAQHFGHRQREKERERVTKKKWWWLLFLLFSLIFFVVSSRFIEMHANNNINFYREWETRRRRRKKSKNKN